MNDSKNLILAVVLSALVLLGWTWAANKYFPSNPPTAKVEAGKQQPLPQAQAQPSAPTTAKAQQSVTAALASSPRVSIRTPSLAGSINLKGAQIDDLLLVTQRQTIERNSPPVRLLSPLGAPSAYIAQFGWTAQGAAAPDLNTIWTADSNVLTPGHPVTLTTQTPDGIRYAIKVAVDDGYLFTVQQAALNGSGKPVQLRPIGLVSRAGKSADTSTWTNHVGPISVFDGKADYDINWGFLNIAVDRKLDSIFDLEDAMKVQTCGDRITNIGKNLSHYDAIDTGLFVCPVGNLRLSRAGEVR